MNDEFYSFGTPSAHREDQWVDVQPMNELRAERVNLADCILIPFRREVPRNTNGEWHSLDSVNLTDALYYDEDRGELLGWIKYYVEDDSEGEGSWEIHQYIQIHPLEAAYIVFQNHGMLPLELSLFRKYAKIHFSDVFWHTWQCAWMFAVEFSRGNNRGEYPSAEEYIQKLKKDRKLFIKEPNENEYELIRRIESRSVTSREQLVKVATEFAHELLSSEFADNCSEKSPSQHPRILPAKHPTNLDEAIRLEIEYRSIGPYTTDDRQRRFIKELVLIAENTLLPAEARRRLTVETLTAAVKLCVGYSLSGDSLKKDLTPALVAGLVLSTGTKNSKGYMIDPEFVSKLVNWGIHQSHQ